MNGSYEYTAVGLFYTTLSILIETVASHYENINAGVHNPSTLDLMVTEGFVRIFVNFGICSLSSYI